MGSGIEIVLKEYRSWFLKLTKKKNTSEMKKLQIHSQLNNRRISSAAANNEIDLCSIIHNEFKKQIVKILNELRNNMNELRLDINSNSLLL